MTITPEKIKEIYKNSTPYQVGDIIKNYIGLEICWNLKFFSVRKLDNKNLGINLLSEKDHLICCFIDEDSFPLIKVIPKDTPVRLTGTIKNIDPISIDIENAKLHEIKDGNNHIYFPQGSRKELLSFLESKVLGANDIKIYDSYPSEDTLVLLESTSPKAKIKLLGKIDLDFLERVKAFNIYFKKTMTIKYSNVSHARFYIIDDQVIQVDTSLKNFGGNKATIVNIILDEEAEKIKKDFNEWWKCGTEI